jgi:hypothetical protein
MMASDPSTHESRSQAIADEIRRLLLAVHTGGIATTVAFASSLVGKSVSPRWAVLPLAIFLFGIVFAAISMLLAQRREIKRRQAAEAGVPPPVFPVLLWSWIWNWASLFAFIAAVISGLVLLANIRI